MVPTTSQPTFVPTTAPADSADEGNRAAGVGGSDNGNGVTAGIITAIIIAVVIVLALVVAGVRWYLLKRQRGTKHRPEVTGLRPPTGQSSPEEPDDGDQNVWRTTSVRSMTDTAL